MTHKYEKKCWSCGSTDLMPDTRGVHCVDCGATWNEVPQLGQTTSEAHLIPGFPQSGYAKESGGTPSRSVARRAAQARLDKGG